MLQFDDRRMKMQKQLPGLPSAKVFFSGLAGKFIAESPYSLNKTRVFHVFFNLTAQAADMDIHGAVGDEGFITPDLIQDLIS
jgi:hypothetical protein